MQKDWFSSWFDTPYYHILYKNRDHSEAAAFIDKISAFLNLKPGALCWDLCCGKGRHSIYLNQKGYRVIGTDLSSQSILIASASANDTLQFYRHDMRNLFRTNYFDVVFNLFTSFGYFEKKHDDLKVFHSVQKSLLPGGLFVFDYLNSEVLRNEISQSEEKTEENITFRISKQISDNTVVKHIDFSDGGKNFHFEERVKLFDRAYFESLAEACNLQILHVFGSYQLDEFKANSSPRLILVMRKL
jgi:SAM-dependent methyltransferase